MTNQQPLVERDDTGETVRGFRVAAWRETHPEHGDKYGHAYSEHWSTPNTRDPRVKVERLFTESQLDEAFATITRLTAERAEQDMVIDRYSADVQRLTAERDALRQIISELGYCTPEASLEFMQLIPAEVRAKIATLKDSVGDEG